MEFEKLVHGYLDECRARSIGEQTILVRERFLLRWGIWLRSQSVDISIKDVGGDAITRFLKNESMFKSKATVAIMMSNLRCFGDYLNREGVWRCNHLKWMQGPKLPVGPHAAKALKKEEVERILAASFKFRTHHLQALWPAMLLCFYSLGLRLGEVIRLNLSDWDPKEKMLRVFSTKSGFERFLPVPDSLCKALEEYLLARHRMLVARKNLDEPYIVEPARVDQWDFL